MIIIAPSKPCRGVSCQECTFKSAASLSVYHSGLVHIVLCLGSDYRPPSHWQISCSKDWTASLLAGQRKDWLLRKTLELELSFSAWSFSLAQVILDLDVETTSKS